MQGCRGRSVTQHYLEISINVALYYDQLLREYTFNNFCSTFHGQCSTLKAKHILDFFAEKLNRLAENKSGIANAQLLLSVKYMSVPWWMQLSFNLSSFFVNASYISYTYIL